MDFQGYQAEQVPSDYRDDPYQRGQEMQEAADSGSLAVLHRTLGQPRLSRAAAEVRQSQEDAAEAMGTGGMGSQAEALQTGLASDPRMQGAFEKNLEALEGMDGLAVRTVMLLRHGPTRDDTRPGPVLAMADQPLSEGVGTVVADAAAEAAKKEAAESARGAVRGLTRGLLGRRGQEEEEPKEEVVPAPVQFILMRVTSQVEDVKTGPLPEELFAPPARLPGRRPALEGKGLILG